MLKDGFSSLNFCGENLEMHSSETWFFYVEVLSISIHLLSRGGGKGSNCWATFQLEAMEEELNAKEVISK